MLKIICNNHKNAFGRNWCLHFVCNNVIIYKNIIKRRITGRRMIQVIDDAAGVYRIPKQFGINLVLVEDVPCVTIQTAEQMNEDYKRNCAIHDVDDRESRLVADTIYAGL